MEHEVHRGDAEHGAVGVVAGEHGARKVLPLLGGHDVFIVRPDVFGGRDKESGSATGRVTDDVVGRRLDELDHHLTDVLRGAELTVLTGSRELAEHVFIEVALHVEVGDVVLIEIVKTSDNFLQNLRRGDEEHRIAHISGKGGVAAVGGEWVVVGHKHLSPVVKVGELAAAHILDGRKDPLRDDVINLARVAVLELAPAHGLTGRRLRENPRHFRAGNVLEALRLKLLLVERADEHKICKLFDNGEGIRNASRPYVRPYFVDFILDNSCNHNKTPLYVFTQNTPASKPSSTSPTPQGSHSPSPSPCPQLGQRKRIGIGRKEEEP